MGLDDFINNDEYSIGSITSRKKPNNLGIIEDDWKHLIMHDPHWAVFFARNMDEKSIRCIAQMFDELIEGGSTSYANPDDSSIKKMKEQREELIEELKDKE